MISAAQVAFNYGGYKLSDAMELSRDERSLLLAVAVSEQERQWERFENILGTSWDIIDMMQALEKVPDGTIGEPVQLKRRGRVPLLVATAPEFFARITEDYKKKYRATMETMRKSGGQPVVEIGTLKADDARAIYKKIGRAVASAQAPVTPIADED